MREDLANNRKTLEAEMFRRVTDAIVAAKRPSILGVHILIENRDVKLRGKVACQFDRDITIAIIRSVQGIREIIDEIEVSNAPAQPRHSTHPPN
jgi:osmotically-inducible protein OsmY